MTVEQKQDRYYSCASHGHLGRPSLFSGVDLNSMMSPTQVHLVSWLPWLPFEAVVILFTRHMLVTNVSSPEWQGIVRVNMPIHDFRVVSKCGRLDRRQYYGFWDSYLPFSGWSLRIDAYIDPYILKLISTPPLVRYELNGYKYFMALIVCSLTEHRIICA